MDIEETIMPSKSTRKHTTRNDEIAPAAQDTAQVGDTAAVSAEVVATPVLPSTVPDTAATRGVWAALTGQPGSTAATLAEAAGISRPTASKSLTILEQAGFATRTEGGREGSKRLPDHWQPVIPAEEPGVADRGTPEPVEPARKEEPVEVALQANEPAGDRQAPDADGVLQAHASRTPAEQPAATAASTGRRKARTKTKIDSVQPDPAKTDAGKTRLGSGQLRDMVLRFLREHANEDHSPSAMGRQLERSSGAISNACDKLQADGAIVRTSDKPRKFRIAPAKS